MAETGKGHTGITLNPARVDIGYWSVLQLIVRAYRLQPFQLIGPDWMGLHRFDVQAKLPQGSTEKQLPEMLQWLLADRFGLKAHFDTKELNGFALEVGKGGVKMDAAPPDPAYLGAPVEDQTGLRGRFRVRLNFSQAVTATESPGQKDLAAGDLFTAVKLLGLKLERRPVRCNVLVVDHVERTPTAN